MTLGRVGITLDLPWRNFATFRSYWLRNDCSGSWQARRDLLENIFEPVQTELDRQEEAQFRAVLAEAVSPHTKTGWPKAGVNIHGRPPSLTRWRGHSAAAVGTHRTCRD